MKLLRKKIKYWFILSFVEVVITLSSLLPSRLWLSICGLLGKVGYHTAGKLRTQIQRHLSFAYGEEKSPDQVKQLTKEIFNMLARNAGVVLRGFKSTSIDFRIHSNTVGLSHAKSAMMKGKGVIFLTAHIGPFECIATELALRGFAPLIVGTPLKHAKLNSLVVKNRSRYGGIVIDRGKETFRIIKNLMRGGTIALLIDQDTNVKSTFVNFFGKPCSTPIGAATLATKTGAAIIPVFTHLDSDGLQQIVYYPEVNIQNSGNEDDDVIFNTQLFTSIIENEIRKFPEQWAWMHRRWRTQVA